jgi:hypothetical protein
MFCSKCGNENPETANFCRSCGSPTNSEKTIGLERPSSVSSNLESNKTVSRNSEVGGAANLHVTSSFIQSAAFDSLIGKNTDYYRKAFLRLEPVMKEQIAYMNLPLGDRVKEISGNSERNRMLMTAGGFNWAAAVFSWIWIAYRRMYIYAAIIAVLMIGASFTRVSFIVAVISIVLIGFMGNSMYYYHLNNLLKKSNNTNYSEIGGTSPLGAGLFLAGGIITSASLALIIGKY